MLTFLIRQQVLKCEAFLSLDFAGASVPWEEFSYMAMFWAFSEYQEVQSLCEGVTPATTLHSVLTFANHVYYAKCCSPRCRWESPQIN